MTTTFKAIERNVLTATGEANVWIITFSDAAVPTKSIALALNLPEKTVSKVLIVNGGKQNGPYITFDTEESALSAIEMLKVKNEMNPGVNLGVPSNLTNPVNLTATWKVDKEDFETIINESDEGDDLIEELRDFEEGDDISSEMSNVISEYATDNLGISVDEWTEFEIRIQKTDTHYDILFIGHTNR